MTKRRLFKEKSLYTLKKLHAKTNVGNIYENDYVTIKKHDTLYDEDFLYSESNFKFKISTDDKSQKRHIKNNWISNGSGYTWTKNDVDNTTTSDETKITLKPKYKSLKDFVYYGSAVELVKLSIKNIVANFPGGLYYCGTNAQQIVVDNVTYYKISNECQIDCWSEGITEMNKNKYNPLRFLSYSYYDYVTGDNIICNKPKINITGNNSNSIIGTVTINDNLLYIYKDENGVNHLVSDVCKDVGIIIEPNQQIKNKFWNELSEFEKILLTKETDPIYKSIFDTPFEKEGIIYYTRKSYILPTVANFITPYFSSYEFENYVNELLELADFHDKYDTDNIWRVMTHESIKNMDDSIVADDDIDYSRMKALSHIQGFQFDEIKRYIDNLKASNTLSYNEQGNMPDYFLTDIANINGWESKNVCLKNDETTDLISYTANGGKTVLETSGKSSSFVNSSFIRRLILSSNYINSMKGTKKGIEAIIGMFGLKSGKDYEIIEYYGKCNDLLYYDNMACLRSSFYQLNEFMEDSLEGYPVAPIASGDTIVLCPWYDKKASYIGDFYYQGKGGWGKVNKKYINSPSLTLANSISGSTLYRESDSHIISVKTLGNMTSLFNKKIKKNMICYVENINGIEEYLPSREYHPSSYSIPESIEDVSHYFILKNPLLSNIIGENEYSVCEPKIGWRNVPVSEILSGVSEDAIRVLNIETMYSNFKGNNPHLGKEEYDFGYDYLDKFKHLFREAIEDGECDNLDSTTYNNIKEFGFNFQISGTTLGKSFEYITEENSEWESYKVINTKMMTIRFNTDNEELIKYITNIIIPYIENMIPSTMIFEYLFKNEPSYVTVINNKLSDETSSQLLSSPKPADEIPDEVNIWSENDTWMNN